MMDFGISRVLIIVPTYNSAERTIKMLNEIVPIIKSKKLLNDYKILIIDDLGSSDYERIKTYFKEYVNSIIHIIHLNKRLGAAGCYSYGLIKAFHEFNADFIILTDNDAYIKGIDFVKIDRIIAYLYRKGNTIDIIVKPYNALTLFAYTPFAFQFHWLIVPRRTILKLGLPDFRLWWYGEDLEYYFRGLSLGVKFLCIHLVRYYHTPVNLRYEKGVVYAIRNMLFSIRRYMKKITLNYELRILLNNVVAALGNLITCKNLIDSIRLVFSGLKAYLYGIYGPLILEQALCHEKNLIIYGLRSRINENVIRMLLRQTLELKRKKYKVTITQSVILGLYMNLFNPRIIPAVIIPCSSRVFSIVLFYPRNRVKTGFRLIILPLLTLFMLIVLYLFILIGPHKNNR